MRIGMFPSSVYLMTQQLASLSRQQQKGHLVLGGLSKLFSGYAYVIRLACEHCGTYASMGCLLATHQGAKS